jgi:molybdopterin molybdotransferase
MESMNAMNYQRQMKEVISIDEALEVIRANIPQPATTNCSLEDGIGKYLAEDVVAPEPSPRYTSSAMDGYALRWQDVMAATPEKPVSLKIVGESQAGTQFEGTVGPGEAIHISTGAVLGKGCDSVVRMEDTDVNGDCVRIKDIRSQGQDVRYLGEEFREGELLLQKGTRITATRAALLTSVGIGEVTVFRPCEVALLITGSELATAGQDIKDDQIRDSNMIMLKSAAEDAGGVVVRCVHVTDEQSLTYQAIAETNADLIICSGGISVGRHDHVKKAAVDSEFVPLFWRIRQKPGKPLYFARKGSQLLFGLPGNPVSAFMCFIHYVRPLISALNGLPFGWPMASAEALDDIVNRGKRPNMARVQLRWRGNDGYCIKNAARQGSHMLTSLTDADGYIILQPGERLKAGERIDVYRYDFLREPVV